MLTFILIVLFFSILSIMILLMNLIASMKSMKNREKISPFECGFDPMISSRMPFSTQFFIISLIFLIFDIEITLLIPLIYMLFFINKIMMTSTILFLLILIFGLMIEYLEQSLDWKI